MFLLIYQSIVLSQKRFNKFKLAFKIFIMRMPYTSSFYQLVILINTFKIKSNKRSQRPRGSFAETAAKQEKQEKAPKV